MVVDGGTYETSRSVVAQPLETNHLLVGAAGHHTLHTVDQLEPVHVSGRTVRIDGGAVPWGESKR